MTILTKQRNPCISHEFGKWLADLLHLDMKTGPWLAGGILQKLYHEQEPGNSDWDIWFSSYEQFDKTKDILTTHNPNFYQTKNALTFTITYNNVKYKVQLIYVNFFNSPDEIINQFDITVCQMVTDGYTLTLGPDTAIDLKKKRLRTTYNNFKPTLLKRIIKYMVYGYTPSVELMNQIKQIQDWDTDNDDGY